MKLKEALKPLFDKKPYRGLTITKIESIAGLGKGTLAKAYKANSIRTGLIEQLCAPTGQEMHLIFKKKKKPILNICILFVMKWLEYPGSVSAEERIKNKIAAAADFDNALSVDAHGVNTVSYSVITDAVAARAAYNDFLAVFAADGVAAFSTDAAASNNIPAAEKWVNEYFDITGENKQDYIDAINKELA